jgi:hypothetical protein
VTGRGSGMTEAEIEQAALDAAADMGPAEQAWDGETGERLIRDGEPTEALDRKMLEAGYERKPKEDLGPQGSPTGEALAGPEARAADGRPGHSGLRYGPNQLALAQALTGHQGRRAIDVLRDVVLNFHGDPQAVLDAAPADVPGWAKA